MQSLSSSQIDSFFCLDAVVSLPAQHAAVSSVCLPSPVLYTPTTPPPPERCFGVCINAALVCACPPPLPCILHRHSSRRQQNVWVSARRLSAVPSTKGRAHTYEQAPALCHAVSYVCLCVTNSLMAARCVMRAARVRGVGGGLVSFSPSTRCCAPCVPRSAARRAPRRVPKSRAAETSYAAFSLPFSPTSTFGTFSTFHSTAPVALQATAACTQSLFAHAHHQRSHRECLLSLLL